MSTYCRSETGVLVDISSLVPCCRLLEGRGPVIIIRAFRQHGTWHISSIQEILTKDESKKDLTGRTQQKQKSGQDPLCQNQHTHWESW